MSRSNNALHQRHKEVHAEWVNQSINDPEFGGPHFARNLELAKQVIARFGGKRFQYMLNKTGIGSHPDMVRIFWKIGQALATPKTVNDNTQKRPVQKSIGELFYPGFEGNNR